MAREILVAGNWKMNTVSATAAKLAADVARLAGPLSRDGLDVACLPPYPYLALVREQLGNSGVKLGAQDVAPETNGAFTGDVAAPMLKDLGCTYVCIGHSERREYHGEGEPLLKRKIARAREAELLPIICVGEPLAVRQRGSQVEFATKQVESLFDELAREANSSASAWTAFTVAYEPIWAIGTGEVATPDQAQSMCLTIRQVLSGLCTGWGEISILYGGSVKASNAVDLVRQPDVDGFLVGGASLDGAGFAEIVRHIAAGAST